MNEQSFHQPEIDQKAIETTCIALVSEVQEEAEIINSVMKSRVSTVLDSSETAEIPKKIRNFGKPPEDFGINIVTEIRPLSHTIPEGAERNGFWHYNRPAFDQLVKMWVLRLLSEKQLLEYINALPGDAYAKAWAINGEDKPFPGYLNALNGMLSDRGSRAYWWVVSFDGSARCVYLYSGFQIAFSDPRFPKNGFFVPVSSDEK